MTSAHLARDVMIASGLEREKQSNETGLRSADWSYPGCVFVLFLKQNNGTHLTAVQAGLHTLVTLSHQLNSVKERLLEHFQLFFFHFRHVARPLSGAQKREGVKIVRQQGPLGRYC